MHCIVIRHVAFEDLGVFCDVFSEEGITYEYWDCESPRDEATFLGADLAIVLGGPIGVGDGKKYPLVREEIALVKKRLEAGLPLLGICLGAQYMAYALGGRVYPGPKKEIGWGTVSLCHKGGLLAPLESAPVLHWHGKALLFLPRPRLRPTRPFPLLKGSSPCSFTWKRMQAKWSPGLWDTAASWLMPALTLVTCAKTLKGWEGERQGLAARCADCGFRKAARPLPHWENNSWHLSGKGLSLSLA